MDDWWSLHLAMYEAEGMLDADQGVFHLPHHEDEDPQDKDENEAYRRGLDKQRKLLGDAFKWAR